MARASVSVSYDQRVMPADGSDKSGFVCSCLVRAIWVATGAAKPKYIQGMAEAIIRLAPQDLATWLRYKSSFKDPQWPMDFTTADAFATAPQLREDVQAICNEAWNERIPEPTHEPIPQLVEV